MFYDFLPGFSQRWDEKPGICDLISEAFAGSKLVDSTEWSAPRNASYSSASPQTGDGVYQVFLDLNDMVAGDELQIIIYEKIQGSGTQRVVYQSNVFGVQSPPVWISPSLMLVNGWDISFKTIAGTSITVEWSIRQAG